MSPRTGRAGVYARLGLYPNLDVSWVTAFVVGPGRPTAAVIDFAAPLPAGDGLTVSRDGLDAEHVCEEALERFRVRLDGAASRTPTRPHCCAARAASPCAVSLDLTWETTASPTPTALPLAMRSPASCAAWSVSVMTRSRCEGVGQRDHSWGTRDWWAAEWMWSAGHLEDGTRFHAVEFRLPGTPPIGVGYLQPPEGGVLELDAVSASEQVGEDGLITSAEIRLGDVVLQVEPTAFGPLRLEAPDGRISQFPRAMCQRAVRRRPHRRRVGRVEPQRVALSCPLHEEDLDRPGARSSLRALGLETGVCA